MAGNNCAIVWTMSTIPLFQYLSVCAHAVTHSARCITTGVRPPRKMSSSSIEYVATIIAAAAVSSSLAYFIWSWQAKLIWRLRLQIRRQKITEKDECRQIYPINPKFSQLCSIKTAPGKNQNFSLPIPKSESVPLHEFFIDTSVSVGRVTNARELFDI